MCVQYTAICKRVGKRLPTQSCRLISAPHLIGSTINEFFISSELWVLEVCIVYSDIVSIKSFAAGYGGRLLEETG